MPCAGKRDDVWGLTWQLQVAAQHGIEEGCHDCLYGGRSKLAVGCSATALQAQLTVTKATLPTINCSSVHMHDAIADALSYMLLVLVRRHNLCACMNLCRVNSTLCSCRLSSRHTYCNELLKHYMPYVTRFATIAFLLSHHKPSICTVYSNLQGSSCWHTQPRWSLTDADSTHRRCSSSSMQARRPARQVAPTSACASLVSVPPS